MASIRSRRIMKDMPTDKRQIHLDPMEWRDAMKDVTGSPAKKTPAKKAPARKKPAKSTRKAR